MPKVSIWHVALIAAAKFLRRSPGNPSVFVHNWRSAGVQPNPPSRTDVRANMRVIETGSLTLEPQTAAHAGEMFAVLSDPAIYEYENEPPPSLEWLRARFTKLESRGFSSVFKRENLRSMRLLERLGFSPASPERHAEHRVEPGELPMLHGIERI